MKPFISRTLDVITLGPVRRRRANTTVAVSTTLDSLPTAPSLSSNALTHSMPAAPYVPVAVSSIEEDVGGETGSWSIYNHSAISPSPEAFDLNEDDVVFCKNNVHYRLPPATKTRSSSNNSSDEYDFGSLPRRRSHSNAPPTSVGPTHSSQDTVPGYLIVSTRGSDFGQTLILNWTPNNRMKTSTAEGTVAVGLEALDKLSESPTTTRQGAECEAMPISLNLGQMESIHIFYRCDSPNSGITGGDLVIYSRERTLFMFSFKRSGLYDLIKKFRFWNYFSNTHHPEAQQYIFTVIRPRLTLSELHLEEGLVSGMLTVDMWEQLQDPCGRILDKRLVLQTVFFRGMELSLRKELWLFLLGVITFDSTADMRRKNCDSRQLTYGQINAKREKLMSSKDDDSIMSANQSMFQQISNDIRRTDRSHPFYKGDDNANTQRLETILLNYLLVYRSDITYCQGMTDILAPILMSLDNDVESFYCFTQLVERSPFFTKAGKRVTLHRQVALLKTLISLLLPWFFSYLNDVEDGLSLLFVHRWLLVSLKREFKMEDVLLLWEACWTNYITNSFHLFVCVAIIAIYGQKALDQDMNINELTVYFNGLANTMPVDVILAQARGYLYQFTKCPEIPCVLRSIMPDDYWETASRHRIICEGSGTCCKGGPEHN